MYHGIYMCRYIHPHRGKNIDRGGKEERRAGYASNNPKGLGLDLNICRCVYIYTYVHSASIFEPTGNSFGVD